LFLAPFIPSLVPLFCPFISKGRVTYVLSFFQEKKKRKLSRTFGDAVERFLWEGQEACDGGYVDDASPAGDGGVPEERVRELAEVEA